MTKEELQNIKIEQPDEQIEQEIRQNWDHIAKPLDGMGEFEVLAGRIGAILKDPGVKIDKRRVIVLCADNGIVEEGISQSTQEVTLQVAELLGQGKSSVCKLAKQAGVDVLPVDIGIADARSLPGVLDKKIRRGSRNFRKEAAMTCEEVLQAIETGISLAKDSALEGYRMLALGEMGIGNTTTSTAVCAALLKVSPEEITGRGAGLSDTGLFKKKQVITQALETYKLYEKDAFEILQAVGGYDIAGLAGICIGAARYQIPVVLDGLISAVAALVAERICPGTRNYLIASHLGKEPAARLLLEELSLKPVIHGRLALGEGTGAVLLFPLLDTAFALYREATTFGSSGIGQYERFSPY